jgi:hypothetical protein
MVTLEDRIEADDGDAWEEANDLLEDLEDRLLELQDQEASDYHQTRRRPNQPESQAQPGL